MRLAPYHSCVSCFRGDTNTAVYSYGEAEWHIVVLGKTAKLSDEEATRTFRKYCEEVRGCDPGKVPTGEFVAAFRLCRKCAAKTGAQLGEVPSGATGAYGQGGARVGEEDNSFPPEFPCYRQPPEIERLPE